MFSFILQNTFEVTSSVATSAGAAAVMIRESAGYNIEEFSVIIATEIEGTENGEDKVAAKLHVSLPPSRTRQDLHVGKL